MFNKYLRENRKTEIRALKQFSFEKHSASLRPSALQLRLVYIFSSFFLFQLFPLGTLLADSEVIFLNNLTKIFITRFSCVWNHLYVYIFSSYEQLNFLQRIFNKGKNRGKLLFKSSDTEVLVGTAKANETYMNEFWKVIIIVNGMYNKESLWPGMDRKRIEWPEVEYILRVNKLYTDYKIILYSALIKFSEICKEFVFISKRPPHVFLYIQLLFYACLKLNVLQTFQPQDRTDYSS